MKLKNSKIDESDFTANIMTIICTSFSIIIIALSIISYLIAEIDTYLIGTSSFLLASLITFGYYVYRKRL